MQGKTHVATGIAASLVILHPTTVTGVIGSVVGGAIGGWISDIDCRRGHISEGSIAGMIITALISVSILFLDHFIGNGICAYVVSNWGIPSIIASIVLVACLVFGFISSHRTFTHSLLAVAIMTFAVFFIAKPLTFPFLIGIIIHILLDLTNGRSLQLLFPAKWSFCWDICDSDGKANFVIMNVSTIVSVIMAAVLTMVSISQQTTVSGVIEYFRQDGKWFGLNNFQVYLLIINAITFVVFCIDHWICTHTNWENDDDWGQNFVHRILNFLGIFGGAAGMLLSFIVLRNRIGKCSAYWYAFTFSVLLAWSVLYCVVCNPFGWAMGQFQPNIKSHLPIIIYLSVINIISFILFLIDSSNRRNIWNWMETILFVIGILGGTIGGLLAIIITGKKRCTPHFSYGFPILLVSQVFLITYLLLVGIV